MPKLPKLPIPLPPDLEAAASAVLEENAKAPAPPEQPASDAVEVGPLRFRRPTLGDLETLRLLQSPWLARIQGGEQDGEPDLLALMDVVFLWTHPPEVGSSLARKGSGQLRMAARDALLDAPLAVAVDLRAAVETILAREFGG